MEKVRELTEREFQATFTPPMANVTESAPVLVDIWPYAETVLSNEFEGRDTSTWDVEHVYENQGGWHQHILIQTDVPNAFLVLVVDIARRSIMGHHFLNLNAKYGLGH